MVAVVADSASNLPPELARELGIVLVPMHLRFGDEVYLDGVDLSPTDFYRRLVEGGLTASTSTPSPGEFLEAYATSGSREIVCVTVASGMSAVHQQAVSAAERFERDGSGRVEVVDSMSASMAEGFVALAAARAAAAGATLEDAAACARLVAPVTTLMATLDTFEFLQRSGRVSRFQAFAATRLDIKPVFRFEAGEVTPVARPRSRRRALERIVDDAVDAIGGRPAHVATIHAAAPEDAALLLERIRGRANVIEALTVEVTPVIGAHVGPGLAGTAFYCSSEGRG